MFDTKTKRQTLQHLRTSLADNRRSWADRGKGPWPPQSPNVLLLAVENVQKLRLPFLPLYIWTWAPAGIFPEGGKTARIDENDLFFGAPKAQTKIFAFFRRFRLNLRVFDASAEGASENFRVFSTGTAYDVIIFKFQGGGNCPRLPPPSGRLCSGYSDTSLNRV